MIESCFIPENNMNWFQKIAQAKLLIIVRGPSGSGKSHITEEIKKQFNAPVFSSDEFWMQGGQYNFDIEYIGDAHAWNVQRAEKAMAGDEPVVIIDNTNSAFWEMKPYVELAQKHGYQVEFKEPDWNPKLKTPEGTWNVDFLEAIQGQKNRQNIGKVVPRESLERMVDSYEYNPTVDAILRSERPV